MSCPQPESFTTIAIELVLHMIVMVVAGVLFVVILGGLHLAFEALLKKSVARSTK